MARLVAFVADHQPPVTRQPGACAFHGPAMSTRAGRILDAPARDAAGDPALMQGRPARRVVVALVGVQLGRAARCPIGSGERLGRIQ